MLKVYDQYKNPVASIYKYTDLCIESELETGDKTLSFTYRGNSNDIKNEYYIETETDRFVVKEVNITSGGFPEYNCQLDLEGLEREVIDTFSAVDCTLQDAANLAVAGTGWRIDTDIEKVRSTATMNATPREILEKIRDAFMCEIRYDSKNEVVYFREEFGEDRGVFFEKSLNLKKVELKNDSYDYYTRILPIGADDLRIGDVNDGVDYLENYQYSDKIKTYLWEDTNYEDPEALKEDAEAKLEDMSKPTKSYSADVLDLAAVSQKYDIMDYSLGDTITLIDEETGIKDKQRIVKLTEYPLEPVKNSCELSNTFLTFEELQAKLDAAAAAFEDITNSDGTVNGYYVHGVTSDGVVVIETVIGEDGSTTTTTTTLTNALGSVGDELSLAYARIGTLEATTITATEADLRYATIEQLEADEAWIGDLEAYYGEIYSLITTEIAAEIANITTLLAGEAGVEHLESIHLVSGNAVIDTAIITDALMETVLADLLVANTIYTDYIKIADNEGRSLWIDGATMQFTDENGIVREQIGMDASGIYNNYIWDENGILIWNALGLTEDGLTGNGAIIRNKAVADDAAISGYKLDIDSVKSNLNESGYTISGAQVTINDETLDYALSSINEKITGLEGVEFEGMTGFTQYWCLWDSAEEAPPLYLFEDVVAAETDIAETDVSYTDIYDSYNAIWSTTQPEQEEDRYLWICFVCDYEDGHQEITPPLLITDAYVREITTDTYTRLKVVEGDIDALVEKAIITDNAIEEIWGEFEVTAESITSQVGDLKTYIDDETLALSEDISKVTQTAEEILSEVDSVRTALDGSVSELTSYIDQTAESITQGVTEYVNDINGQISTVETQIKELSDSIELTATKLAEDYTTTADLQIYVGEEFAAYDQTVNAKFDGYCTTAEMTSYVDSEIANLSLKVAYTSDLESLASELGEEIDKLPTVADMEMYVTETMATIDLSVSGSLGGIAGITLTVGGTTQEETLDLSEVREAFAAETSTAEIKAGKVIFYSNTLEVNPDDTGNADFIIDENGNATFGGYLNAPNGHIGGWEIGDTSFYNGLESMTDTTHRGIYMGTDGYRQRDAIGQYLNITSAIIENGTSRYGSTSYIAIEDAGIEYSWDNTSIGFINSTYGNDDVSDQGVTLAAAYKSKYLALGIETSADSGSYNFYYILNNGLDPLESTADHVFNGTLEFYTHRNYLGEYIRFGYSNDNPYIRLCGVDGQIQIYCTENENRGLYNYEAGHWIVYANSSNQACVGNGTYATHLYGTNVFIGSASTNCSRFDTSNDSQTIITGQACSASNTGHSFQICVHGAYGESGTNNGIFLNGGADSSGRYLQSYTVYSRTYSSSPNIYVTTYGTLGYTSGSSIKYKNSVKALSNPENVTQNDVQTYDTINQGATKTISENTEIREYAESALSLLKVPICLFNYNDGYINGEPDFDYEKPIVGFIAEDLEKICPDCVVYQKKVVYKTDENGDYIYDNDGLLIEEKEVKTDIPETWGDREMIPRIVYILQYQQAMIENQAEQIEALENRLQAIGG